MKNYELENGPQAIFWTILLLLSGLTVSAQSNLTDSEPKSTHTWLDSDKSDLYNYDIDVRIVDFPSNSAPDWLYYFAIQVNFTGHDEWSHGGFQLANVVEFSESNRKGVNWGGGSDWAGYGGIGRTNTPFTWELDKWYRYRVWRLPKDDEGFWQWGFWVLDYETGVDQYFGTVRTKSEFIENASVWIETGYGVQCNTERAAVEWRNPTFQCLTPGQFSPNRGTATYNGTCKGASSTDQGMISTAPLTWFQRTKSRRAVSHNERLWGK
jgi:hypothetical protein